MRVSGNEKYIIFIATFKISITNTFQGMKLANYIKVEWKITLEGLSLQKNFKHCSNPRLRICL